MPGSSEPGGESMKTMQERLENADNQDILLALGLPPEAGKAAMEALPPLTSDDVKPAQTILEICEHFGIVNDEEIAAALALFVAGRRHESLMTKRIGAAIITIAAELI